MGEAKRRGTFEERKEAAIKLENIRRAGLIAGRRSIGKSRINAAAIAAILAASVIPSHTTDTKEGRSNG